MKLFQQLLVAPAALGLMAPLAASAAELNISDYSDSIGEVESISQFSDVYPTDWAYQALTSLAERHGCATASPSGSMTRYEAAALLNKCLGNVAQVNDEERRLLNEFGPELAVIKGRLDGLEARIGEFEAGQFSSTTKLSGKVAFQMGAVDRDTGTDKATTFTYMKQLNLNTSFTGRDLLYTRIKTGNTPTSTFASKTYGAYLSSANTNGGTLKVDKLWYQFPVGDDFTVWVGPRIENYYMLASAPSIYKPVLKQFALGGNGATYGASTDGGFGVAWTQQVDDRSQPRFAVSSNYVSKGAADPSNEGGGVLTDVDSNWLTKLEYGSPRWQVSFALAQKNCNDKAAATYGCFDGGSYFATQKGKERRGNSTNYALRAYWKPDETGFIPEVQAGYDWSSVDADKSGRALDSTEATASWMMGFTWKDLFIDGNALGIAIGQRQHATDTEDSADDPAVGNFVWEAYYDFKVSDNITVTPAIFGGSDTYNGASNDSDDISGAILQTTFKF